MLVFDDMPEWAFGLYKLVKVAVYPLTWIWALMILTVVLLFCRQTAARVTMARITACSALALLYGLSAGRISDNLVGMLEQVYPPYHAEAGQSYDAIVVLDSDFLPMGGMRPVAELSYESLQRTLCGAGAYSQGLSKKLVLSGGPGDTVEMAELALRLDVPEHAIVLEGGGRNTYESAKEVRKLLGPQTKILLVTSAIHIPRAVRLFQKQGLKITPYPCGYQTAVELGTWGGTAQEMLLPDINVLVKSTLAVNELAALAVYGVAGKL
jgi:uncharacterized SAM-binding protein YcdF (DUF218 family)